MGAVGGVVVVGNDVFGVVVVGAVGVFGFDVYDVGDDGVSVDVVVGVGWCC